MLKPIYHSGELWARTLERDWKAVVGHDEKPEPHFVDHEPTAGMTGPVQGILALPNPLLCRYPPIVEMHYTFRHSGQVADDEV